MSANIVTRSGGSGGGVEQSFLTNCVVSSNSAFTGGGASHSTLVKCSVLSNSCTLGWGGGASGCTLTQCMVTGNSSRSSGGGVVTCTINDSMLSDNTARFGGACFLSSIINCTVTRNSATEFGGGTYMCWATNSIVYYNTAAISAPNCCSNYFDLHCCTTPLPSVGTGNITNEPLFMDLTVGDFRLRPDSPCINAGNNSSVSGSTDLDGNSRIAGGTVDLGAYEFQTPTSGLSYAWLQQYGLPTDGSADYADTDCDGLNNSQEWRCQTVPTDSVSALRLASVARVGNDVRLTWQSVAGVHYFVECSSNALCSVFLPVAITVPGQDVSTTYTHTNGATGSSLLYRVGVRD